jgi:toxin HigB-1
VIKTFKSKELSALFAGGRSKIDARLHRRIITRLDTLDRASSIENLMIEGYNFHPLRGFKPTRYTIHVNGPWCITFEFLEGHVFQVDLEQYH